MSTTDWQTAAERLNRYAQLDPSLRHRLEALSKAEARDDKLAFRLEEGRTYGMRQQFYVNRLKRDFARALNVADITEEHW